LEKEQDEAEAKDAIGGYLSARKSARSNKTGDQSMAMDDDEAEETDSIVIDTSDVASMDAEQHVEEAAELYAQKYMNEQK
jgi:hypothetical protein